MDPKKKKNSANVQKRHRVSSGQEVLLPVVSLHVHLNLFILIAESMKSYENLFRLLKHNYKENYRTHSKHSLIRGLA